MFWAYMTGLTEANDYFSTQADKLNTLIKAAKIIDVEPIWTSLFAKVRILLRAYDTLRPPIG